MKKPLTLALILLALGVLATSWFGNQNDSLEKTGNPKEGRMVKTDAEWQEILTPEQYRVTRKKGTERAFTGEYWNSKESGIFHCVCCGQPLFDSDTKYDSGTGWPSFWQPVDDTVISLHSDRSWLMRRTEVTCSRCDAHLGHVFGDGPPPTGQRYCMNSAAMRFIPVEKLKEEGYEQYLSLFKK